MILLIDNYDSFVYNLGRYFGRLGRKRIVVRNDALPLDEIGRMKPEAIVLSPGPRAPKEAGICLPLIEKFHDSIPILGICLGHQCIGEAFGGRTMRALKPAHGKASAIENDGNGLFAGLPPHFNGGRYHSLVTDLLANAPLKITARAEDGAIMAVQHERFPVYGLQFHPESVLTEHGLEILRNFINAADAWNAAHARRAA
ncbi:MAG: aminodeoxychorismate/anthranilate synthase component II [Proteobacteria bacterium]|nr:aminodeoxychorismate/anthranilate synthase component II [Pseudomonadota bacterium]